jgi:hypothetical protein
MTAFTVCAVGVLVTGIGLAQACPSPWCYAPLMRLSMTRPTLATSGRPVGPIR